MNRFNYDYTAPYVALAPKGKHATRQIRRRYCLLVLGGGLLLALLGYLLPAPATDAYVMETPAPKHAEL